MTLSMQITQFSRLLHRALRARLAPYALQPGQIPILEALHSHGEQSQKELLEKVPVEQPTIANTLKRMEREGLVCCAKKTADKRTRLYTLSSKGKQAYHVAQAAQKDLEDVLKTQLTVSDLRYFRKIMSQMTLRVQEDIDDPALFLADVVKAPSH